MIAAGEVVEGPSSVVKELVENAIDAGATEIAIDVKGGGSDLIRVADNGCGMGHDDALSSFNRFATSKLSTASDLESISTLGFRGEALPSISSVSRVRLVTCEEGSVEGTEINVVAGEIKDVRPAARARGTTVDVTSLFFNTPARRKFLKSDRVEVRKVLDLMTEYAVLYTSIRFDLAVDGKLVLGLMPTDGLMERVAGILGGSAVRDTLPVSSTSEGYRIEGLVGKPSIAKPRPSQQVISVNGRPIRSRLLSAAVRSGYAELLPRNRHPVVFILLTIDGSEVDVNVHPTKREVRFGDSRKMFGLIEKAVRDALMSQDTAPTLSTYDAEAVDGPEQSTRSAPAAVAQELAFPVEIREAGRGHADDGLAGADGQVDDQHAKFWQLHQSYVFVQTREGVLVIDQHAAHERVLYEKARVTLSGAAAAGPSQQLLFPVAVELSPGEWESLDDVRPLLDKLGFTIGEMSGRTVMLEAVPGAFPRWPHDRILHDILTDLPSGRTDVRDLVESIATTVACKAAIKAGDRLTLEEMRALVDQLFATELPYSCPHGRPTFMRMTTDELNKRFGRT